MPNWARIKHLVCFAEKNHHLGKALMNPIFVHYLFFRRFIPSLEQVKNFPDTKSIVYHPSVHLLSAIWTRSRPCLCYTFLNWFCLFSMGAPLNRIFSRTVDCSPLNACVVCAFSGCSFAFVSGFTLGKAMTQSGGKTKNRQLRVNTYIHTRVWPLSIFNAERQSIKTRAIYIFIAP